MAVFSDYEDFLAFDGMDAVGLCVRRKEVGGDGRACAGRGEARQLRGARGVHDGGLLADRNRRGADGAGVQPGRADTVLGCGRGLAAAGIRGTAGQNHLCRGPVRGVVRHPSVFPGFQDGKTGSHRIAARPSRSRTHGAAHAARDHRRDRFTRYGRGADGAGRPGRRGGGDEHEGAQLCLAPRSLVRICRSR